MRILLCRWSVRCAAWRSTIAPANFVATWVPVGILSVVLFALARSVAL